MNNRLSTLLNARADQVAAKDKLLAGVEARGARDLTSGETAKFQALRASIRDLDAQIEEVRDEEIRAGRGNPAVAAITRPAANATMSATSWSHDSWAERVHHDLRESRALVSSGSLDVPHLLSPAVVAKARPSAPRLIDLLVNRQTLTDGTAFEFFQQTIRTNNAAFTADGAVKPTSTFTVDPKQDRARVIATLTEPAPVRLLQDAAFVVEWLEAEAVGAVLDALEAQIVSGNGTGENVVGILDDDSGVPTVAFVTDAPTTIRKALTSLQVAGEVPNAIIVNPSDAENLDLFREGTGGVGFLTDGFSATNDRSANVYGDHQRVVSNSVPAGTAIIGDWNFAKLWVREDMRLDTDFGGELFTKNQFILRAEMRVGFGLLRPTAFRAVDLTA